ncbi:MAG: sugar isomerase, partial [Verrucomicrobiota bacterium]|nr:sugar isomerase [Verrucomicrobiota bacterium]
LTGIAPSVALHIPWDKVGDFDNLRRHAESLDIRIGSINPNLFQDDDYMLGSVCNADANVRRKAIGHMLECVQIAKTLGSHELGCWFADGTNYPGQADIRARKHWMEEALHETYAAMNSGMRMLVEYKFYEPAFYHTDIADWGMAYNLALKLGPQAQVLVDLGHHAHGTNIEHIVAYLLDEEKLGCFHFNNRKYGDDDLIAGSINPYELFLVFHEIRSARQDEASEAVRKTAREVGFMIDQTFNIEPKIPGMIRSLVNIQTQYARSLLVNTTELRAAQTAQDVLRAEAAVRDAYEQDVLPWLQSLREELGLPADPVAAYLASGYPERLKDRT